MKLVDEEVKNIPDEKVQKELIQKLERVAKGERDLYF